VVLTQKRNNNKGRRKKGKRKGQTILVRKPVTKDALRGPKLGKIVCTETKNRLQKGRTIRNEARTKMKRM